VAHLLYPLQKSHKENKDSKYVFNLFIIRLMTPSIAQIILHTSEFSWSKRGIKGRAIAQAVNFFLIGIVGDGV
jgi:hypothetical protein